MRLEQVRLKNYRCYINQDFVLGKKPVQLFLAPNGGGKSALVDGLAALVGKVPWVVNRKLRPHTAAIQHTDVRRQTQPVGDRFLSQSHYPCTLSGQADFVPGHVSWSRSLNTAESRHNTTAGGAEDLVAAFEELPWDRPLPLVTRYATARFPVRTTEANLSQTEEGKSPDQERRARAGDESPHRDVARIRQAIETDIRSRKPTERSDGYLHALDGGMPWHEVRNWWFAERSQAERKGLRETTALTAAAEAISALLDITALPRSDLDVMDILVPCGPDGSWVPAYNLSDGFRVTLALAVDLARRACALNPAMGSDAPRQTSGTVLIDEIDLHLHPAWQRSILTRLNRAFPKLQFVVTTHAPQVVVGAGDKLADVFVLEPSPDGVPVPRPTRYEPGHSVDDLLTGPWFKQTTALDDDTGRLLEEHNQHFDAWRREPDDPDTTARYRASSSELRRRLDRSFGSPVENIVLDIVLELARQRERPISEMDWEGLQRLRRAALDALGAER